MKYVLCFFGVVACILCALYLGNKYSYVYVCEVCEMQFSDKEALLEHKLAHNSSDAAEPIGEREVREDAARTESGVIGEESVSQAAAPGPVSQTYTCPHKKCGKEFSSQEELNSHILACHPFVCEFDGCRKKFLDNNDRRKHYERDHRYVCPFCRAKNKKVGFAAEEELAEHIHITHNTF